MSEINKISQKLLAEGWTKDQTPPGMKPWDKFYGGWTYAPESRRGVVFETPCGLLYQRNEVSYSGTMYFMGIDWTEENDCITVLCPYYDRNEHCDKNHPLLEDRPIGGCHYEHLTYCAIHETEKAWDYERSAKKVKDENDHLEEERWLAFAKSRHGRVCEQQCRYNRNTGEWKMRYDPMQCPAYKCSYCSILGKPLEAKRGNVFYDLKVSWTVPGMGLYQDEKKTSITKGIKLLDRPCSMTICEAIAKVSKEDIQSHETMRHHTDLFLHRLDSVEVFNIRAEVKAGRDLHQDLKDFADGIEIHHAADDLAAAAQVKRKHRDELKRQNQAKAEKMILRDGYRNLSTFDRRRVKKYLAPEEIQRIEQERAAKEADEAAGVGQNYSLFEDGL